MNIVRENIISEARAKGICKDGYANLCHLTDDNGFVSYYIANPDWCMERDFPTLDFLTAHFSHCEGQGVYVNKEFNGELLNDMQVYILHNCRGTIRTGLNAGKQLLPMLYLANGCDLHILGFGDSVQKKPSIIPIYVFGQNNVSAKDDCHVKFLRYNSELI